MVGLASLGSRSEVRLGARVGERRTLMFGASLRPVRGPAAVGTAFRWTRQAPGREPRRGLRHFALTKRSLFALIERNEIAPIARDDGQVPRMPVAPGCSAGGRALA